MVASRREAARRANEGYGEESSIATSAAADDERLRGRATTAREFDPAEISARASQRSGRACRQCRSVLVVVVVVNLVMSLVVLPRLDVSFLAEQRWGSTSLSAVAGVWSVVVALAGSDRDGRHLQLDAIACAATDDGCRGQRVRCCQR